MGCLRIKYDDGIPAPKNWKVFVGGIEKSEAYRYDYQGQFAEKDGETGLHSFEYRNYDSKIGRWISVDRVKRFASPYIGMGNNPLIYGDPDGRDIVVLLNSGGASGFGHMAVLIGNEDKGWQFISNEGAVGGGPFGKIDPKFHKGDDTKDTHATLDDFFRSKAGSEYNKAFRIKTGADADDAMAKAAKDAIKDNYCIVVSDCQDLAQQALRAGGLSYHPPFIENPIPNIAFESLLIDNWFFGNSPERVSIPTVEVGPIIYNGVVGGD